VWGKASVRNHSLPLSHRRSKQSICSIRQKEKRDLERCTGYGMIQVRGSRASRLPSDPNPYGPTQPFRRMHQIQQRRQAAQLLFGVLTATGA